jgi:SAM-dependent methyltransferase
VSWVRMTNGWKESAEAWIAAIGEQGDWGRRHVLDPVLLGRLEGRRFERALDVGCGEGRFCRLLRERGIAPVGIDPTPELLEEARRRDPAGDYRLGRAETLEFPPKSFDLVVSYLTLIDIPDYRAGIAEMARVLKPGGTLLVANLTSFITAGTEIGWVRDAQGRRLHWPVDRYLEEFSYWVEWDGIRIVNWHRPLGAYMAAFLEQGLALTFFAEPDATSGEDARRREAMRRAPWYVVMEWRRSA